MRPGTSARDRAVWGLYADWCLSQGSVPLPSDPLLLARFLEANPAAAATQRRRVSTVNAVHRVMGHAPPGRSEAVRRRLDDDRVVRLDRAAHAVARAVTQLPQVGWPTELFARRDAALLVLSTTGLRFDDIARLRVGDVTPDGPDGSVSVQVGGEFISTADVLSVHGVSAAQVLDRWLAVRAVQHHRPSARAVAAYLRGAHRDAPAAPAELALVTPLDRWGAHPLGSEPLRAASVSAIVGAHLAGAPPRHKAITAPTAAERADAPAPAPPEPEPIPTLDPDSYERGASARRNAAQSLIDLPDVLDEVEDRAEKLMQNLLALLDGSV